MDTSGTPPLAASFPGLDQVGHNCRISPSVGIRRHSHNEKRGIFLGNGVILYGDNQLVIGDLNANQGATIELHDRVIINVGGYISGEGGLVMEEDVLIGPHARILSAGHMIHGFDAVIARNPLSYGAIHIGKGAWVGAGCTILQGVDIGEGAVIGAGSVVTKSIPPFAVAIGAPARVLHFRKGHVPKKWWHFWVARKDSLPTSEHLT